jgi:predicted PurR-regulated permease PerM
MSRWVSLFVLLLVIGATGYLLYRVMASFILPLFLAVVLTIIFRPLQDWMLQKLPKHEQLAALLTTLIVLATVLLPLVGVVALAIHEGLDAVRSDFLERAESKLSNVRTAARLNLPFETFPKENGEIVAIHELESLLASLPDELPTAEEITPELRENVDRLFDSVVAFEKRLDVVREEVEQAPTGVSLEGLHQRCVQRILRARENDAFKELEEVRQTLGHFKVYLNNATAPDPTATTQGPMEATDEDRAESLDLDRLRQQYVSLKPAYNAFRIDLLGGPIWSWLRDLANPNSQRLQAWFRTIEKQLSGWLPSVAGQATAVLGRWVVDLAIMSLALFYFLKDGPSMVRSLMWLSPLDDRHEEQLLGQFSDISRAVVLATLLSAVVQGVLAAPAYYLAGFQSVFMLMFLTMVLAMVPFVGAAAIWFPACLWLAFVDQSFAAAIGLFLYGVIVISMADNIVKPYVLAGKSKLHPLLGLLSVLGGVQALGAIGILVGPMVVSFLQALLTILNQELAELDASTAERVETKAI